MRLITFQVTVIMTRFHSALLTGAVFPIRGAVLCESIPSPLEMHPVLPARQAKAWQASPTQAPTSRPPGGGQRVR